MSDPTITDYPGTIPGKSQSQAAFDTNVDAFLNWLTATNVPEYKLLAIWIRARVDEVAATALSGDLPSITAQAGNFVRVNSGATAMEFRTPSQLLADIGASTLAGRNLIINPLGAINQIEYVSGAATSGAKKFTLDQWCVLVSGQNLTFTGTAAGRAMTAPAGGVAQVIDGSDIVGGTYVINWPGTATCTVGGVARLKGDSFTLTANTDTPVVFTGGTFSTTTQGPKIELGTVPTTFGHGIIQETSDCLRYFQRVISSVRMTAGGTGHVMTVPGTMLGRMRATPTIAAVTVLSANVALRLLNPDGPNGWRHRIQAVAAGDSYDLGLVADLDARIYP